MYVTQESWLEFLNQSEEQACAEAKTKREWAEELGRSDSYALKWIRAGLKNSWLELVWVFRARIDGVSTKTQAYRITDAKTKPKSRGK